MVEYGLNIPSFLGGRAQLMAAEVKENQTIASVRIHIQHTTQRVEKFKVIRNKMPSTKLHQLCMIQQINFG